ncbi:hypothetical protein D918_04243 [Trichuris suis]|nr:hypothetical protein D918_04243 [Trichuris suis]
MERYVRHGHPDWHPIKATVSWAMLPKRYEKDMWILSAMAEKESAAIGAELVGSRRRNFEATLAFIW